MDDYSHSYSFKLGIWLNQKKDFCNTSVKTNFDRAFKTGLREYDIGFIFQSENYFINGISII